MRIKLLVLPYKVKSMVPGWNGWRINQWGFVWKEKCECDDKVGCIAEGYDEPCECTYRPPHTHTWAGYLGSKAIFFPKKKAETK